MVFEDPERDREAQIHPAITTEYGATPTLSSDQKRDGGGSTGPRDLTWAFLGPQGLRAGWSALLFLILLLVLGLLVGTIASLFATGVLHVATGGMTPAATVLGEGVEVVGLIAAMWLMAKIERRRVADYNLRGSRGAVHFASGLLCGFVALTALVGVMAAGGWLHFGPIALSGAHILKYAALWAVAFFLVGCVEEGMFRCYLQYTLTRGINFWWALALIACVCLDLLLRGKGNGIWGVYLMAGLGVLPCLWLQLSRSPRSGFWQAAWVTSTLFGFVHTGNNGENWIGIFAAAAIGFVFCVSVYVTGSAWWAIGCHASWDWGETYFYGTADSGLVAKGHLLSASPAGSALWSGGTDGPEGSVLVLAAILLLLVAVLLAYGRGGQNGQASVPEPAQAAG